MSKGFLPVKRCVTILLSLLLVVTSIPFTAIPVLAEEEPAGMKFDFGTEDSAVESGYTKVSDQTGYSEERGYGFADISKVSATVRDSGSALDKDFVSYSETAFQVDLPAGDYAVDVILGDKQEASNVGVLAEQIQKVQDVTLNSGETTTRDFEIAVIDGQLSIELSGDNAKMIAISITPLPSRTEAEHPTVFVASDSTAQTYDPYWKPQAGWGQMLERYFKDEVTVDNQAIGGRSSRTFYSEGRLDNILREIKPNDYLLIQFGHNDATKSVPERYTSVEDYKVYLETYVTGVRQRGGIPILVTPVNRRDYNPDTGIFNESFPGYVQGMKEVSEELDVLLVDLSASSRAYFNEIGPQGTLSVFMHLDAGVYEAYPDGRADDTHFQEYGAIQIARLLSGGIKELDTSLASYVADIEAPEAVPAKPNGVTVSGVSNAGAVLTWEAVENADIYRIYRKLTSETEYEMISTSTIPQLNITGMEEGNTYDVVITAVNGKGESEQSDPVQINTKEATYKYDFGPEGTPILEGYTEVNPTTVYTKERGYGLASNDGVIWRDRGGDDLLQRDWIGYFSVGWDFNVDVPNGLYAVKVYVADFLGSARTEVKIEDKDYGSVNAPRQGSTSKVIPEVGITDGQMNVHFGGSTGIANGLELTPILLAPSALKLDDQSFDQDNASASLSWQGAEGAAKYNVYRKTKGSDQVELIDTTTETSYTDTTVEVGLEYEYTVSTIDNIGTETVPSLPLEVKMIDDSQPLPDAPENLTLGDVNKNDITLSWDAVDTAVSYNVYRSEKEDGTYTLIGQTRETSYTDNTVLTTIPYFYKVAAVNAGGISEQSDVLETPADTVLLKQMEDITRDPVAVKTEEGVFVSWRMLGTDPANIGFNLYRDGEKITSDPITERTNFVDKDGKNDSVYEIQPLINGQEQGTRSETAVFENNYLDIPLNKPEGGETPVGDPYEYRANDASVGDVDGDGEYELIVKWDPTNSKDSSQSGYTGNVYVDAYEMDGTQLWRIDLGVNIRAGAHYTQFIVYDFDGDGKAEVAMKTADGTIDGKGNTIGRADADHRYTSGYVLQGDEFLTIFNGETGAEIDTVEYDPPRGDVGSWGDTYGNRVDRFLAGVAYLNGETPSLVMARGYYTRMVVVTYNFVDGKLEKQWKFDTNDEGYSDWVGQGYHSLSVADVDHDQKDEIIYGQVTIDDDGTGLYNSGLGHGDALHVSDFIPDRKGLEIYSVQEHTDSPYGYDMRDAETGEVIWGVETGLDTGRGLAADVDPNHKGAEAWAVDGAWNSTTGGLHSATGEKIAGSIPSSNFAIWWDGDLQRELLNHDWDEASSTGVGTIENWDYENNQTEVILRADGTLSNNGTKGTPALQADLFGDWREEAVWRLEDSSALRVYMTTDPTDEKIFTLMHDPQYRAAIAWQNVGYNQPPHPSFYIGSGMSTPSTPRIDVVETVNKDTSAPETSAEIEQTATNDWYNEDVTVNFTTTDAGSSVDATHYVVNNGKEQTGNSITLDKEGEHTINYWSVDEAGNVEEAKSVVIKIDKTAPTVTFSVDTGKTYTVADMVTITCEVTDELSGMDSSNCNVVDKPAYELGVGTHSVNKEYTDLAGNNTTKSLDYTVTVDFTSLAELTKQFNSDDANGLTAKLDAAKQSAEKGNTKAANNQLDAYINQVNASIEKSLTTDQAAILIELAKSLKNGETGEDPSGNGKIVLGKPAEVEAGKTYGIDGTKAKITMPDDLPNGTKVIVVSEESIEHDGLEQSGDILTVTFKFPEDSTPPTDAYTLVLGYKDNADAEKLAIYYFNEESGKWEQKGGDVDETNQTVSLEVPHFSTYGVFVEETATGEEDGADTDSGSNTDTDSDSGNDPAPNSGSNADVAGDGELPSTATTMFNWMLIGLIVVALGIALLIVRKRRVTE
ncbi:rhamnogalacturonan lyase family protein [Aquibacillus kalidii]|uniref:rhamnogalacturonan lyase family protein n=1 Tax=Aquibacillus kalidii TaxID=2762597 RepID=UPI0016476FE8|nr:fibronectin type III domain-containing protein [Aquibacillus kalidii]